MDRAALRLGVLGHVECRRPIGERSLPLRERGADRRERLGYATLIAAPLIELASSAGWSVLPGAPLSTIAA